MFQLFKTRILLVYVNEKQFRVCVNGRSPVLRSYWSALDSYLLSPLGSPSDHSRSSLFKRLNRLLTKTEDGNSMSLRNISIRLQGYTLSM
jgi:hypothetical protein